MTDEQRSGLRLHVGCGSTVIEGWENIDKSPSVYLARFPRLRRALLRARILNEQQAEGFPVGVIHADASERIPFPDGSAAYVYSSHMIEHLSRERALDFIGECRRVLADGGVMRTATPDLASLVSDYLHRRLAPSLGPTPADAFMSVLGTYHEIPANRIQRMISRQFSGSWHQWLYDAESLTHLLFEGGLEAPRVCGFREGETPDLDVLEQRPESLFIEARR